MRTGCGTGGRSRQRWTGRWRTRTRSGAGSSTSSARARIFGTVAASGIRTLSKVDYDGNQNMVIVATALAFGVIPIAVPAFYAAFPDWMAIVLESGISAASLVAVVLNLLFNGSRQPTPVGTFRSDA